MRAWLVLLVLAAPLLAPPAGADHVYSHRFVFEGRVVGANGLPAAGRNVSFFAEGDVFQEPCAEGQRAVTDENGDFRFCYHKHALNASTVVGVRVDNVTVRKPMDTAFRRTVVLIRDPDAAGVAPPGWNDTFRVAGRVWRGGATVLEGVPVYGLALARVPVNLTLTTTDGGSSTIRVTTDGYGDFDATMRLVNGATPANVTLRAESMGKAEDVRLDETFHRNTVGFILPAPGADVQVSTLDVPQPGSQTPRMTTPMLGVIVGSVVAAVALGQRKIR